MTYKTYKLNLGYVDEGIIEKALQFVEDDFIEYWERVRDRRLPWGKRLHDAGSLTVWARELNEMSCCSYLKLRSGLDWSDLKGRMKEYGSRYRAIRWEMVAHKHGTSLELVIVISYTGVSGLWFPFNESSKNSFEKTRNWSFDVVYTDDEKGVQIETR